MYTLDYWIVINTSMLIAYRTENDHFIFLMSKIVCCASFIIINGKKTISFDTRDVNRCNKQTCCCFSRSTQMNCANTSKLWHTAVCAKVVNASSRSSKYFHLFSAKKTWRRIMEIKFKIKEEAEVFWKYFRNFRILSN